MASLREQALRRKPVATMAAESGTDTGGGELAREIGLFQLSLFGIGATIGTGIFIVLTIAVPVAGPAVIVSFVIAGTVAGLTAICYAELASAVPVSGSSYSYAYATLGEGVAMVVAACLLLEYGVSSAAVSPSSPTACWSTGWRSTTRRSWSSSARGSRRVTTPPRSWRTRWRSARAS